MVRLDIIETLLSDPNRSYAMVSLEIDEWQNRLDIVYQKGFEVRRKQEMNPLHSKTLVQDVIVLNYQRDKIIEYLEKLGVIERILRGSYEFITN